MGLLADGAVIEKRQRLGRDSRRLPRWTTDGRVGRVKCLKKWKAKRAAVQDVDRPAVLLWRNGPLELPLAIEIIHALQFLCGELRHEWRAKTFQLERPCSGVQVIPHLLRFQSPPPKARQQMILWIDGDGLWIARSGLAIRGGEHKHTVEFFQAPTIVDQLNRQPIEQLWM